MKVGKAMNISANILRGEKWRVYWEVPPYRATSKGFFLEHKARGFKHYLAKAFGIKSSIKRIN